MNNRTKHAAMLAVFLGWFCFGCGKSPSEPAASVPIDCQKFLEKYFDAVKSKDVGKIQEFSSYVPPADSADRSEEHTSELQSRLHLVCRLLLEKKKKKRIHKRQLIYY